MIILGRIEVPAGFDLGDDRSIKHARLAELRDVGLGKMRLLRIGRENRGAVLEYPWTPQKQPPARTATSDVG